MPNPLRIANCSGFYGDRLSAAREMVTGGPIDFLTGDYLAELTMMILWKARQKEPSRGYAVTFLKQMEDVLGEALERRIKIVTNAGGLNPEGLAAELRTLCDRLGLKAKILHIEGDDLMPQLETLQQQGHELRNLDTGRPLSELKTRPLSANAYLGAWGIVEALNQGAEIVVCPRVTDASVVVGPAPGILAGNATTGIAWPARSSPDTSLNAARNAPAATTHSFKKCPALSVQVFRSSRLPKMDRASSPSTKRPADLSRWGQ